MIKGYSPSPLARGIDSAVSLISPKWGLQRKRARVLDFLATFEGAKSTRYRSSQATRFESQDANASGMGRVRMLAEARDLEDNCGLVVGINRMYAKYVAGKIRPKSRTGNPEHDKAYQEYFNLWSKICDVTGRHNFTQLVQLATMATKREGDIGFIKIKPRGDGGFPTLQPIEADRIGSPWQTFPNDKEVAGVLLDDRGAPVSYRIYNRIGNGQGFTLAGDIARSDFIHVFDPTRFDQYRGVSAYHAVINDLRDIKEILEFEKMGVKWASSQAAVITKQNGVIGSDVPLTDETTVGGNTDKLETFAAATVNYLAEGEKFEAFTSDRPSQAFIGFIPMLIRMIAVGLELPFGFVWDMSGLGGVPSRFESKQAERTFARFQDLLDEKMLDPIWSWVIADGIQNHGLPVNENFWRVQWQFGAHPTVDVGRESVANLNENRQGLKSAQKIYGEQGEDWEEEQEQCAIEASNIKRLAEKYGVDVDQIRMLTPNGNGSQPAEPADQTPPTKQAPADNKKKK